ncbi:MAG: DinB family protein, partial [Planctomycetota bacterium]|nr:DinB family protein [Planctomycetota bacterium]
MHESADLLRELNTTDRRMLALIDGLSDDQLAVPYEAGINPPIWELGHAAFFTEYFFLRPLVDSAPRMAGYDEIWDSFQIPHRVRWQDGVVPDKHATLDYYRRITNEFRALVERGDLDERAHYLARYSIYHQNMHVESLIWCRQTLGYPRPGTATGAPADAAPVARRDVAIPGGVYPMGIAPDTGQFAFDNEKPGFTKELAPFSISNTLVTNREFLEFVADGGYTNRSLWSYPAACWLDAEQRHHPLYWRRGDDDGSWQVRHFDAW